jgi:hydrogenase large subunit
MYAQGHETTQKVAGVAFAKIKAITKSKSDIPISVLHSTLGRHAARAIRTAVLFEELEKNYNLLINNIAGGDMTTFNPPVFPKGEQQGFGFHEAPRGVLSHWIVIKNGKIENYQAVVPSTWNAAPRNDDDAVGPYEASLMGNPIADDEKPLEVLRTIHSFDPCLACAIHLHDNKRKDISKVHVL